MGHQSVFTNLILMLLMSFQLISCGKRRGPDKGTVTASPACIIGGVPVVAGPGNCGDFKNQSTATDTPEGKAAWEELERRDPWKNTVALVNSSSGHYFCSGVMVHPQFLLTAAHCLPDPENKVLWESFLADTLIYFGLGREGGVLKGQLPISNAFVHPSYQKSYLGRNDLAVIKLQSPWKVPQGQSTAIPPILWKIPELQQHLQPGTKVTMVGFGKRDNGDGTKEGLKFQVEAKILEVSSQEITIGEKDKDTCNGDSGGPVFIKGPHGDWQLLAITSRGPGLGHCGEGPQYPGYYQLISPSLCSFGKSSGLAQDLADLVKDCAGKAVGPTTDLPSGSSFLSYCRSSPSSTVQALMDLAGVKESGDCNRANQRLLTMHSLALKNKFLSDLTPLTGLTQIESIDLRDNFITSVLPLQFLPQLKAVNLDYNTGLSFDEVKLVEAHLGREIFRFNQESLPDMAATGRAALLSLILDRNPGMDPDRLNGNGQSALVMSVQVDSVASASLLLQRGANIRQSWDKAPLLLLASSPGMVDMLLTYDPSLNGLTNSKTGQTALMVHSQKGHLGIVELLLRKGAKEKINLQDEKGLTALMYASWNGHFPEVEVLCQNGADKNLANKFSLTAGDLAKGRGHPLISAYLRDHCP